MRIEISNKELQDIFSTVEYEEDGGISIKGADWQSDELRIKFEIKTGNPGESQLWKALICGVSENLVKSDLADKLELFEEHPLLWTYNQTQTSLYFGRAADRPYELFANIYGIHQKLTENQIPFGKYLNKTPTIELVKSPTGLFASGPIKIIEAYKEELERHNMKPTIVGRHSPNGWSNRYKVDESVVIKILVIGDSYVIGETFHFQRV